MIKLRATNSSLHDLAIPRRAIIAIYELVFFWLNKEIVKVKHFQFVSGEASCDIQFDSSLPSVKCASPAASLPSSNSALSRNSTVVLPINITNFAVVSSNTASSMMISSGGSRFLLHCQTVLLIRSQNYLTMFCFIIQELS